MSFPRARRYKKIETEWVGSDAVVFVRDTYEYHCFSNRAYDIWNAADGERSKEEIARLVYGDATHPSLTMVQIGLEELSFAGLLDRAEPDDDFVLTRRTATKLAAASLFGTLGLPTVSSITAPTAAQGLSPNLPPTPIEIRPIGANCSPFSVTAPCAAGACCCHDPGNPSIGVCRFSNECAPYTCG